MKKCDFCGNNFLKVNNEINSCGACLESKMAYINYICQYKGIGIQSSLIWDKLINNSVDAASELRLKIHTKLMAIAISEKLLIELELLASEYENIGYITGHYPNLDLFLENL